MAKGAVEGFTGEDARRARNALGLTQFHVAHELKLTAQAISNFERGRYQLGKRARADLARLLGLPPDPDDEVTTQPSRLDVLQAQVESLKAQMDGMESLLRDVLEATRRLHADGRA